MSNTTASIFDIQRNSFVDGPGIRTTVFFKGCNLKCAWCHNPEGQSTKKEWMVYPDKCVGCGRCVGMGLESADFICFHDARMLCGKEYTVDDLLSVILKDKAFYESSGGGVTFSGGECMLQIDFLFEILKECKKNRIHTAVDTAGNVPYEHFEQILPYTDLFLYDVKCFDSETHKKYTGVGNELILENLKRLLATNKPVWIRIPIIPTVNDTEKELQRIKKSVFSFGNAEKVELLPYHAMGEHKYAALGRTAPDFSVPSKEKMKLFESVFHDFS